MKTKFSQVLLGCALLLSQGCSADTRLKESLGCDVREGGRGNPDQQRSFSPVPQEREAFGSHCVCTSVEPGSA